MKHRLVSGLLAGAAALALTATAALPATAGPMTPNRARYAAVGDSYAAGLGVAVTDAYPVLLAGKTNKVTITAQSGATTGTTIQQQVALVPTAAKQITVTVGGNDVGFGALAMACEEGITATCVAAVEAAQTGAAAGVKNLPTNLGALLRALRSKAPNAVIYVTGYPKLFQPLADQCGVLSPYADTLSAIDAVIGDDVPGATLNGTIAGVVAAANAAGDLDVKYAGVTGAFGWGGLCSPTSKLQGLGDAAPLHPNAAGQLAYAQAIETAGFTPAASLLP